MSGLGTTRHLREAGREDFVIGVTGNALISDQKEYLEAGADQYVSNSSFDCLLLRKITLIPSSQRPHQTR